MVEPGSDEDWRRTCSGCGEIVGAFEPVVVLTRDGRARETSLGAARALLEGEQGSKLLHDSCYRDLGDWP